MYPQNNFGAGAQWTFATTIVIVVLALMLGILISNSEWLQPEIADATADGMQKTNDIEYQQRLIDLKKHESDSQAAIERTNLSLDNQKMADQQFAEFRQGFYDMLNSGLLALFAAVSVVIVVWGAMANLKSYKLALLEAETIRNIQIAVRAAHRQPSAAAQQARAIERLVRQKNQAQSEPKHTSRKTPSHIEYLYTRPFWPNDSD
jgi:ABC-type transport system involved in cytochrome bd biosynthesis fused ATPase/permease subunit